MVSNGNQESRFGAFVGEKNGRCGIGSESSWLEAVRRMDDRIMSTMH
jgi:hypothetical protein